MDNDLRCDVRRMMGTIYVDYDLRCDMGGWWVQSVWTMTYDVTLEDGGYNMFGQ